MMTTTSHATGADRDLFAALPASTTDDHAQLHDRLVERGRSAQGVLDVAYRTIDSSGRHAAAGRHRGGIGPGRLRPRGPRRGAEPPGHRDQPPHPARARAASTRRRARSTSTSPAAAARSTCRSTCSSRTGSAATVLDHLREIGYGDTASYAAVAAATGNPSAVRAVGTACAHQPAAASSCRATASCAATARSASTSAASRPSRPCSPWRRPRDCWCVLSSESVQPSRITWCPREPIPRRDARICRWPRTSRLSVLRTFPRWEEGRERGDGACSHPREEELRSDRATILRETVEAYADLRYDPRWADGGAGEPHPARRVGRAGLGPGCFVSVAARCRKRPSAFTRRVTWAPGSFWGLRFRDDRNGS